VREDAPLPRNVAAAFCCSALWRSCRHYYRVTGRLIWIPATPSAYLATAATTALLALLRLAGSFLPSVVPSSTYTSPGCLLAVTPSVPSRSPRCCASDVASLCLARGTALRRWFICCLIYVSRAAPSLCQPGDVSGRDAYTDRYVMVVRVRAASARLLGSFASRRFAITISRRDVACGFITSRTRRGTDMTVCSALRLVVVRMRAWFQNSFGGAGAKRLPLGAAAGLLVGRACRRTSSSPPPTPAPPILNAFSRRPPPFCSFAQPLYAASTFRRVPLRLYRHLRWAARWWTGRWVGGTGWLDVGVSGPRRQHCCGATGA